MDDGAHPTAIPGSPEFVVACVGAESTESQAGERGGASEQGEVGVTYVCQCRLLRTGFTSLTDRDIPTISDLLTLRTFVGRAVKPRCQRVVAAYSLVLAGYDPSS